MCRTRCGRMPGLRFRDCEIRSLALSGAADSTIMAIAGPVSSEMLEWSSHVRMAAGRAAMETPAMGGK